MFKTYVDVTTKAKMPDIIKDVIEIDNGWEISTIIYRKDYVRFYFSYPWWHLIDMAMFKKAVRDYEKRIKYYDTTAIPKHLFAQEARPSSEEYKKELTRFAYATVQGDPEGRDGEAITNENGTVVGYKK